METILFVLIAAATLAICCIESYKLGKYAGYDRGMQEAIEACEDILRQAEAGTDCAWR